MHCFRMYAPVRREKILTVGRDPEEEKLVSLNFARRSVAHQPSLVLNLIGRQLDSPMDTRVRRLSSNRKAAWSITRVIW